MIPLGIPMPRPKNKGKGKPKRVPFHPYPTASRERRPLSPTTKWRAALTDPLDEAMELFKRELDIFPSTLAIPAWKDLQAHLRQMKKVPGFDRKLSIPQISEFFATMLERVRTEMKTIQEDEKLKEEMLALESAKLVDLVTQFREVQAALEHPGPGQDLVETRRLTETLTRQVKEQEELVDMLDSGGNPADTEMGDDQTDAAAVPEDTEDAPPQKTPCPSLKELWLEDNYQNYSERVAPLFPAPKGKVPLTDLFVQMEEPVDSKLYLPRPLELYTVEELTKAVPKGMAKWNNRYEDPMEPAKSWTWEEFSKIYNEPGYHFMIARVAQVGPQCKDPKLSMLRSKLAARWRCSVMLQKMDPRQDWMLCTVPSDSDGEKDAQKFDLIRLSEGNAVYIIRRFAPARRARDLEWVVKGSLADHNAIYQQMRKRLLQFEMDETRLGWHVLGVRKAGATSKFWGTFILDSASAYWPWTMTWGHKHGSVPESSPLLNFDPTWSARRPYACQCCYSTDHFTEECPLPFMKIGGTTLVSHPARTLVIKKKAGERIISLEKSTWEMPILNPPGTPARAPIPALRSDTKRAGRMTTIAEERPIDDDDVDSQDEDTEMSVVAPPPVTDPPYGVIDTLYKFLMLQLHGNITEGMGLTSSKIQFLCKSHNGSLHHVLASLRRDGWLPPSVSDQVMAFKYDRFVSGTPPPEPSGTH